MGVAENSSGEEKHCVDIACRGPLTRTPNKRFWKCTKCLRLSCIECNAVHDGESCATYRTKRDQQEQRTAATKSAEATSSTDDRERGACGGYAIQDNIEGTEEEATKKEARRETATTELFVPGSKYFCLADGCTYETVLHKGSCKFWCPWCHTQHEIEGDVLFKYNQLKQII